MKFTKVEATGNYVILQAIKVDVTPTEEKRKSGIILPGKEKAAQKINADGGKVSVDFIVSSIGPDVNKETCGFKVGDMVVPNDYDVQSIRDDEDNIYGIVQACNIKAVIEVSR